MKRFLSIFSAVVLSMSAFGQGQVMFNNLDRAVEALYSSAIGHQTEIGCSAPWIVTTTKDATDTAFAHNLGLMGFIIGDPPIPEIPFGVPEPSMLSLMLPGFAILLLHARRKVVSG
jgi:hypothetical protein